MATLHQHGNVANCNFVQILSEFPKNPEISLKIPKFLHFRFLRNLGRRPLIVCSFESLPKRNFVNKYAGK